MVAWDPNGKATVKGVSFQVYATTDTAFLTPLPITDPFGAALPGNILNSGTMGVFPQFQQASNATVVIADATKTYAWTVVCVSNDATTASFINTTGSASALAVKSEVTTGATKTALDATYFSKTTGADLPGMWVTKRGSDANDGRSPGTAKATIASAWSALQAAGATGSIIQLGSGTFTEEVKLQSQMRIRGVGPNATTITGVASSSNPGVLYIDPTQAVYNVEVSDLFVNGVPTNTTQCGLYAQGTLYTGAGSGIWYSRFTNLKFKNAGLHQIWLRGGGTSYLAPNQFLTFQDIQVFGNATGYGVALTGQCGQISFNMCQIDGPGKGGGSTNIRINRECSDNLGNTILSDVAPYSIVFYNSTSQNNSLVSFVDRGTVLFDGLHVETCTNGIDTGTSSTVHIRNSTISTTGDGVGGYGARSGNGCILYVDKSNAIQSTQTWVRNGGSIVVKDALETNAYNGSGHTIQVGVAAAMTLNYQPTWLVTGDGGVTPLATITSNKAPGELLYLKAWTNSFKIATGGNIDISGRVSPVTVAAGQVATFVRFDLGSAWQLLGVQ